MADTIKIGNLEIDNLKVGTLSVDALYIGDVKIYPSTPTPTPTYKWVSYNEGDTIPSTDVYNTYGFKIPTQTLYDIVDNGKEVSIDFSSEEQDQQHHPVRPRNGSGRREPHEKRGHAPVTGMAVQPRPCPAAAGARLRQDHRAGRQRRIPQVPADQRR